MVPVLRRDESRFGRNVVPLIILRGRLDILRQKFTAAIAMKLQFLYPFRKRAEQLGYGPLRKTGKHDLRTKVRQSFPHPASNKRPDQQRGCWTGLRKSRIDEGLQTGVASTTNQRKKSRKHHHSATAPPNEFK